MRIFKDCHKGHELCSDVYKLSFPPEFNGDIMVVEARRECRRETGQYNTGQNASQEQEAEEVEENEVRDLDVALNHHLEECTQLYIKAKDFHPALRNQCQWVISNLNSKFEGEELKERKRSLKDTVEKFKQFIKDNFKELQFYKPAETDADLDDLWIIPVLYQEDSGTYLMYYWKDGLLEQKM